MLILTRRIGEAIYVGDDVLIRVVSVSGKKIRLGIEAPAPVRVDREEIRRRRAEWDPASGVGGASGVDPLAV